MPRCGATSMKIFPLTKGGGAERQGVVRSAFPNPSRQPPEGFAFLPPFLRGTLRGEKRLQRLRQPDSSDDHVNDFDSNERNNHTTDTIDEDITP